MRRDEQKRARVVDRLKQPDAAGQSDRAIARELGVSQPFVGRIRRALASGLTVLDPPPPTPERGTGAAPRATGRQAPDGGHHVPDAASLGAPRARPWTLNHGPDPSRDVLGTDLADAPLATLPASPTRNAVQQMHIERYGVPVGDIRVSTPVDLDIANERAARDYDPIRRTLEPRD